MKIMGRVVFRNMKGAEAAEERLRAAGYETYICWDVIDVYSGAVYMEIFRDFGFDDNLWEGVSGAVISRPKPLIGSCTPLHC